MLDALVERQLSLDQCLESVSATEDVEDAAGLELLLTDFLERLQEGGGYLDSGGEDDQAECFIKTLPLVAAGAGPPREA